MLSTSLKIALRGFLRNRFFTAFNLVSLVAGLFVVFVAMSYIQFEYSYDEFHEESENIYRLGRTTRSQDYSIVGFERWNETTNTEQLKAVNGLKDIPGVESVAQFMVAEDLEFAEIDGSRFQEKGLLTTNTPAEFISLFTWESSAGSLGDFGMGLNKAILTESSAKKIIGSNATDFSGIIGSNLELMGENYQISAVIKDVPKNSHFTFNIALNNPRIDYWGSRVYLRLEDSVDYLEVSENINGSMASINPSLLNDSLYKGHFLQPITDIHLKSNILYESKTPGNYIFISLIGGFALFILLITLFNYANFTLASKSKQGKSIGIKKVMGAKNSSVAFQLMVEGVLLSLLSLPVLAILTYLLVPFFNDLMGVEINSNFLRDPKILGLMVGVSFIIGILASIAPAILFSNKSTLNLFKENLKDNRFEHFSIRKYLVVSQFAILIIILSISYFINNQMAFIESKDLGFDKEGVLYTYGSPDKLNAFQEELRQVPEIYHVGNGSNLGIETYNQTTYKLQGSDAIFDDANQLYMDYEALKAYDITSTLNLEGETGRTTIINRTAAEKFAKVKNTTPEKLIGTMVITEPEYVSEEGQVGVPFTIGGIFEDINLFSLKETVTPYFIMLSPNVRMDGRSIVSFDSSKTALVVDRIKEVYQKMDGGMPLEINFLNDNLGALYRQERQAVDLIFYMNILAILLSAIGIIGITVFLVLAKRKEIGIRKVLGASDVHIMKATVKEYVLYCTVALIIGWPIAYYGSGKWLDSFAYKVEISQYIFLVVALLVFVGTAILVGTVALNAAHKNPVKSLRTE